jgi:ABC-type multidrug transport system fused ATPase/permease subunit
VWQLAGFFNSVHRDHEPVSVKQNQVASSGLVQVQNLTVAYDEHKEILKDLNYTLHQGEFYCLVGPSGIGKSTFVCALLDLLSPKRGGVFFNRNIIKDLNDVGYLPQSLDLFSGSLADNIAYPHTPDENKVWQALAAVGIKDLVSGFVDQIHMKVGRGGSDLSGGQTQLIFLARLAYHDFPFYIIDEGTSALDPEIEKKIYEFLLEKVKQGTTVLMISHRPTAYNYKLKFITLKDGKLIEQLTPQAEPFPEQTK